MDLCKLPESQLKKLNINRYEELSYKDLRIKIKKSFHRLNEGICYLCGLPVGFNFTVDHAVPISKNKSLEYKLENLFLAHNFCNNFRSSKSLIEASKLLKLFISKNKINEYIIKNLHFDPILLDLDYKLSVWRYELSLLKIKNKDKHKPKINELVSKIKKYEDLLKKCQHKDILF